MHRQYGFRKKERKKQERKKNENSVKIIEPNKICFYLHSTKEGHILNAIFFKMTLYPRDILQKIRTMYMYVYEESYKKCFAGCV